MVRFYNMPKICAIPGPNGDFPNLGTFPACARCEIKLEAQTRNGSWADEADSDIVGYYTSLGQQIETKYTITAAAGQDVPLSWEMPEIQKLYQKSRCDDTAKYPVVDSNGTMVPRHWNDGYPKDFTLFQKNKWKWASSFLNLALITIFGALYRGTAIKLNDWENHRTQIEYDDNLILKDFSFQFINNYFILFYIAYMRQVGNGSDDTAVHYRDSFICSFIHSLHLLWAADECMAIYCCRCCCCYSYRQNGLALTLVSSGINKIK